MPIGHKFGERFFHEQIDLGRRELGSLLYEGSNIAQPMYPLRGTYGPSKEMESPDLSEKSLTYEEMHPVGPSRDDRDDPGREDRDLDRQ